MGKEGPETRLVRKMREAAKKEYGDKVVTIKYHGSAFTQSGVSDVLCSLYGVFVAVEVKAPESYGNNVDKALKDGPTVKQRAFVKDVLASGGVAGFAATIDQFMEILACAYDRDNGFGGCGHECQGHNT